jgi:hypothetical protein
VAVKGILVFWKAALFAGRRRKAGLGRSVGNTGILPALRRTDDSGCPKDAEEGNVVGMRHKAHALYTRTRDRTCARRTRPSLGPLTRARQSSLRIRGRKPSEGGAHESASRLGKPGEPGGTSTGVGLDGRSAARRVSPLPQGRERDALEEEGGRGLRPCEDRRVRVWLPARRVQLQKSVSDGWSRISSANALQKERQGRVNGDLALRGHRRVKPPGTT